MGYVYAALWFVVGMILVFKMGKENKAFFAVGGFFFFWGVWQTLNEVLAIDMYSGIYGWIHKGVALLALILCILVVYGERKKSTNSVRNSQSSTKDDSEKSDKE